MIALLGAILIGLLCILGLAIWSCIRMAARNEPYPCRECQEDCCTECEFWKEAVGDDG